MNSNYSYAVNAVRNIELELDKEKLVNSLEKSVTGFFAMLANADHKIKEEEVRFINDSLGTSYDKKGIERFIKENDINSSYKEERPEIIDKLGEMIYENNNYSKDVLYAISSICDVYKNLGLELLSADDSVTHSEIKFYTEYMHSVIRPVVEMVDMSLDVILEDEDEEEIAEKAEEEPEESLENLLHQLDDLVGLENVKSEIHSVINLVKVRKIREERGFKNLPVSYHMVFTGNPGTGKTTVARLLAKIYKSLGILSKGQLVETERSGLVAGYIGQTAIKTKEVIDSAIGGILFIDEAYALAYKKSTDDYGSEAINTLLKYMEDNREDFIVIVAGYPEPMDEFIHSNPGLESRFTRFIAFDNYCAEELYIIFNKMAENANYKISDAAKEKVRRCFDGMTDEETSEFGNARGVRNLFERVVVNQASRIVNLNVTDEELITIQAEDIR